MASVAPQLVEEVTAHAQSDSLEDAREICADGTYFPNNLRTLHNFFCLNQPMHNYTSQQYLCIHYILLRVSTCLCDPQGTLQFCLANLHIFLKLKLLMLRFNINLRSKYIKIIFGRLVMQ